MDRRTERWVVVAWAVLGLTLGGIGSIGVRARENWKPEPEPKKKELRMPDLPAVAQPSLLAQCRLAVRNAGVTGRWRTAESTCRAAQGKGDEQMEAAVLLVEVSRERDCAEALLRAGALTRADQPREVFGALQWYEPGCRTAKEARTLLLAAIAKVETPDQEACLEAAADREWGLARLSCARAMNVTCWRVAETSLETPRGKKLSLWGKVTPNGWRPVNPVHLALLRAQAKEGDLEPWSCPARPALLNEVSELPPEYANVRTRYRERYIDGFVALAVEQYHAGKITEAIDVLRDRFAKIELSAAERVEVGIAMTHISDARVAYRSGLNVRDLSGAAAHFRRALESDEQLVLDDLERAMTLTARDALTEKSPSWLRQSISESMHRRGLARGKALLAKGDRDGACEAWVMGLSFATHPELERLVRVECGLID